MKKLISFILVVLLFFTFVQTFTEGAKAKVFPTLISKFNGEINIIYVEDQAIMIGTEKGLYVSQDHGKSFKEKNNGIGDEIEITDIKLINGTFYIGTNGKGLFSGTLDSKNWVSENSRVDCPTISSIYYDSNTFYVASHCTGFYVSFDNGNTFKTLNSGLSSIETTAFYKVDNNRFYLGTEDGLYYASSINSSTTWRRILKDCSVTSIGYINSMLFIGTNIGLFKGDSSNNFIKTDVIGGNPFITKIESIQERLVFSVLGFGVFATVDGLNFYKISSEELSSTTAITISKTSKAIFLGDSSGNLYIIDLSKPLLLFSEKVNLGSFPKGYQIKGSFPVVSFGFDSFSGNVSAPSFFTFQNKSFSGSTTLSFLIKTDSLSPQTYNIPLKISANGNEETIYISFIITETKNIKIKLKIDSYDAYINDQLFTMDAKPFIDKTSSRTLVPIRFISEAFGAEVSWDATTKKVTVNLVSTKIEMWIEKKIAKINGKEVTLDVSPQIVPPGRTFVPIRFISEAFGAEVIWDGVKREITINYTP